MGSFNQVYCMPRACFSVVGEALLGQTHRAPQMYEHTKPGSSKRLFPRPQYIHTRAYSTDLCRDPLNPKLEIPVGHHGIMAH